MLADWLLEIGHISNDQYQDLLKAIARAKTSIEQGRTAASKGVQLRRSLAEEDEKAALSFLQTAECLSLMGAQGLVTKAGQYAKNKHQLIFSVLKTRFPKIRKNTLLFEIEQFLKEQA